MLTFLLNFFIVTKRISDWQHFCKWKFLYAILQVTVSVGTMQLTLSIAVMQLTSFAIMRLCVSKPGQVLSAVWTRNLPILVTTPWPNKPLTPNLNIIFSRTDNSFMIKWYKELPSRSWHVLFFTLHYFSLIHTLSFSAGKLKVAVAVILSKLDYRPLFNNIYYKIILVWELI